MNPQRKIVLLTASHLCNNPRAVKEADALSAAGFEVEVMGWITTPEYVAEDQEILGTRRWSFVPCINLLESSSTSRIRSFAWRAERRIANALAGTVGWQSAAQLGGWHRALLSAARRRQADLFIAHSALTIWAGLQLQREGRRVGVDMEDWFSQGHPVPYPSSLVARGELELLRIAPHATCTSMAMSRALADEYGGPPPKVVYNAFPWIDRQRLDGFTKDKIDRRRPSIHWYSQTLGKDRGLEDLFAALPHVKQDIEVHLRGTLGQGTRAWLDGLIPDGWRARVHVHGPVRNSELLSRIAEHDIGFAGETRQQRNHDLTVSNKILHYLLAGLAIVASDTQGQREVAESVPGAIVLYRASEPQSLAAQINALLGTPGLLRETKQAALDAARDHFCWERIAPRLVDSVAQAVDAGPVPVGGAG